MIMQTFFMPNVQLLVTYGVMVLYHISECAVRLI